MGGGQDGFPRAVEGVSATAKGFLTTSCFSCSAIKWNFTKVRGLDALAGWTDTATSHSCAALRVQSHGDSRWEPLAHLSPTVASLQFLIDKNGCVVKRYGPMEEPLVGACPGSPLGGLRKRRPSPPSPPQVIEKDLPCYL